MFALAARSGRFARDRGFCENARTLADPAERDRDWNREIWSALNSRLEGAAIAAFRVAVLLIAKPKKASDSRGRQDLGAIDCEEKTRGATLLTLSQRVAGAIRSSVDSKPMGDSGRSVCEENTCERC